MGCYVNPSNVSKEEFLVLHGVPTNGPGPISETHLPVCLVDNGMFTAAGVGFSEAEVEAFNRPDDRREKMWFMVSRANLRQVSDLANWER
jgi:hypothetical protein